MNSFPWYCLPFLSMSLFTIILSPTDAILQAYHYSSTISIANVQRRSLLYFCQFRSLQLKNTIEANRYLFSCIPFGKKKFQSSTMRSSLLHECFPEQYNLNISKSKVSHYQSILFFTSHNFTSFHILHFILISFTSFP